jgi:hypothetical protein
MEKGKARQQEEEMSPKGAKRARVNDAGDAVPSIQNEENEEQEEGEEPVPPPKRVKTLPRDVDGYARFPSFVQHKKKRYVRLDSSPAPSCASSYTTLSPTTLSSSARDPTST